ncbi:phospholipase D-like domain-containing protein [Actinomadura madurae]|uniref:phospholipase D-like domain-containing protein n=1 Tax=Actinomadura madurae TaxID=1993 RepID=UPI0020D21A36|nr:phospholipase D-like domain-containing protein [Actinomadura madurae]MCP9949809.1 phospholipase D-like domain-containing protein [Actinomadura madurae]MCP9966560.1 phospholipase D-like domain-containing protein [Actinomadura madurae]MCP9979051.1 phospholipase D-like domain-containing protein [Actinomadura madurae]MCQ0009422.1 phospholipase D-like domain-containing protein [Actinomadura madurae]MCQ0015234.1 phospholipase D-like domain-containing protein [Actinomadura madurae]
MRSRGLTLGAAAILAAIGLTVPASAAAPPRAGTAAITATATFNTPGGTEIVDHLTDLVQNADQGSTIMFTAYRFEEGVIADSLIDAARSRGVKVRLLVDGGAPGTENQQFARVKQALDGDGDDETWARYCRDAAGAPDHHSCQGTGSMHNKFVLFSKTKGTSNVVSTGSANLNGTSGRAAWNSWYTRTGDAPLFQRYAGYFADMARMRTDLDYYNTNPPATIGDIKSYFYPRERVDGDLSANDTVVHTLQATGCPGAVRIANWSLTRSEVGKELVRKAKQGCTVSIVARKIHEAACTPLATAVEDGLPVRMWSYEQGDGEAPNYVHAKDLLIEAPYPNTTRAKVVFTGTANLNRPSLEANDENVIRIMNDDATYTAFVRNHDRILDHVQSSGQGFAVKGVADCDRAW